MFISPIHGKKKPRLAISSGLDEDDNTLPDPETHKKDGRSLSQAFEITKARLGKIAKRSKSGSKVFHPEKNIGDVTHVESFCLNYSLNLFLQASDWSLGPKECILMLGWRPDVVEMIKEYDNYLGPGSVLVCVAVL